MATDPTPRLEFILRIKDGLARDALDFYRINVGARVKSVTEFADTPSGHDSYVCLMTLGNISFSLQDSVFFLTTVLKVLIGVFMYDCC